MPAATTDTVAPARRVLVLDTDATTSGLLREWLAADGWQVDDGTPGAAPVLALIDVPYARDGCVEQTRRIADAYPGTPLLALSATLFAGVLCAGECARKLGVAGVLPKPVSREALIAAVRRLARR